MFDIDSIREINIIKQSDRQNVTLAEDTNGTKYIQRKLSGDKRELYKTLQKINHVNIPKIYYIGFDGDTLIIEEYIDGIALSDFMEQKKKLNRKQIYSISKQILSAMESLHKADIIHRDIKPDNIMIDKSYRIWLTDYDISRIHRNQVKKDTETIGTFGYAPIEQYGMLPTDFKTDIYAFGVTLATILDHVKLKGFLYKIAEKCKRLDPSQRYKNAKEAKMAITVNQLKYPIVSALFIIILLLCVLTQIKPVQDNTTDIEQVTKTDIIEFETVTTQNAEIENNIEYNETPIIEKLPQEAEDFTFEGSFYGFQEGTIESEYKNYSYFSNTCIFSMNQQWEHIIFLDDTSKTGKIKLGKNNTIVDADLSLNDGTLSIVLNDNQGHTYSNQFKYDNQYEYTKSNINNIRKNADIICYDFDGDGGTELLIGLNEGTIGTVEKQVYNNFNYCIAWCISYDEKTGFTLCDGDMFSKGYSFWLNNETRKFNVSWENIGDVTGYLLEDNKIVPN